MLKLPKILRRDALFLKAVELDGINVYYIDYRPKLPERDNA